MFQSPLVYDDSRTSFKIIWNCLMVLSILSKCTSYLGLFLTTLCPYD